MFEQFVLHTADLMAAPPDPFELLRPPPEIRLPPNVSSILLSIRLNLIVFNLVFPILYSQWQILATSAAS